MEPTIGERVERRPSYANLTPIVNDTRHCILSTDGLYFCCIMLVGPTHNPKSSFIQPLNTTGCDCIASHSIFAFTVNRQIVYHWDLTASHLVWSVILFVIHHNVTTFSTMKVVLLT